MDGGWRLGLRLSGSGLIQICLFLGKLRLIALNSMAGSEERERCTLIPRTVGGQVEKVDLVVCWRILSGRGEWAHTHAHFYHTYKDFPWIVVIP